ncbi:MAG: hypothetical protein ABIG60_00030 [Patescibacteria group bacterium]
MRKFNLKNLKVFYLVALFFVLTGCQGSISDNLELIDQKIGDQLNKIEDCEEAEGICGLSDLSEENNDQNNKSKSADLTDEQKEKIEQWIKDNNLNRYGDPIDTLYTGGTPLFNEATSESLDRFYYILNNHPDLLDEFN